MYRIKAAFDPDNLMNPGKIDSPDPQLPLTPLDAVPFRGPLDAKIGTALSLTYEGAIKCNGNGQCMGREFDEAICPSYKATGDRLRSPKGRGAALLRAWARQRSAADAGADTPELQTLESQLYESMSDCLSCKACTSQCPDRVDIPKMRSRFYDAYFARHRRPLSHHLLARMEDLAPLLRTQLSASSLGLRLAAPLLRALGLVDLPPVRPARRGSQTHGGSRGKIMLIAQFPWLL